MTHYAQPKFEVLLRELPSLRTRSRVRVGGCLADCILFSLTPAQLLVQHIALPIPYSRARDIDVRHVLVTHCAFHANLLLGNLGRRK